MTVHIARVYAAPGPDAGARVLVDRLWPRGVAKATAPFDEWCKDVAPSNELRTWYGHREEAYDEFAARYTEELAHDPGATALQHVRDLASRGDLTLLTASKALDISQAAVLRDLLEGA